ncbi:hypothetical protein QQ045_009220 [Rhodiola kirilowii]
MGRETLAEGTEIEMSSLALSMDLLCSLVIWKMRPSGRVAKLVEPQSMRRLSFGVKVTEAEKAVVGERMRRARRVVDMECDEEDIIVLLTIPSWGHKEMLKTGRRRRKEKGIWDYYLFVGF